MTGKGEEQDKVVGTNAPSAFDDEWLSWRPRWNPHNNPATISCRVALDAIFSCFSGYEQFRRLYQEGSPSACQERIDDLKLCLKAKANASRNPEKAQKLLQDAQAAPVQHEPSWKHYAPVWSPRTVPLAQFNSSVRDDKQQRDKSTSVVS